MILPFYINMSYLDHKKKWGAGWYNTKNPDVRAGKLVSNIFEAIPAWIKGYKKYSRISRCIKKPSSVTWYLPPNSWPKDGLLNNKSKQDEKETSG
jgi:hypothetical protein